MTTSAAKHRLERTQNATRWSVSIAASCFLLGIFLNGPVARSSRADDPLMLSLRGATMGTTYSVKVFDPPASMSGDIEIVIDAELRRVNDQMSTYLSNSEISRFNASESLDWFEVSSETAMVLQYALEVSEKTNGAFDVTVGPLVNLWGFGPEERNFRVPTDEAISQRQQLAGLGKLEVRLDPPALKKSVRGVQVDLSAIAKGHGVDRIVDLLNREGAQNLFVEIGGEVRVTGDKAGQPWMVGVQMPDASMTDLLVRHPIRSESMATSGDYRNRFEADGKLYSHTIDPRTGRPVTHALASVTVLADTCMKADAWATAIDVLGPEAGLQAAKDNELSVLLVTRQSDGSFGLTGTEKLAQYAIQPPWSAASPEANAEGPSILPTIVAAICIFGVALAAMAVGVLFGRRPISGSCGGLSGTKNDDGTTRCSVCSNPVDGCKELRDRMAQSSHAPSGDQQ